MIRWEPRCAITAAQTHTHTQPATGLTTAAAAAAAAAQLLWKRRRRRRKKKHSRVHDYTVERQKTSAAAQETIISQLKLASRHFLLCFLLYTCGISPQQQQQQQPRQIIDRPSQQQQQHEEKLHSIASLSALLALLSSAAA